ncbi:hypothetical protein CRD60_06985 [Bifidobacterium aemilianum]|uniref:Uncharacterized protein n=2 Tax=Bifidobacterium aemilianum TaxID=2493120 RepID=A0A366K6S6_9BIFI|nr:hypothetical protein CRD60_06985 [Bifidobacterium aemilianum]
MILIERPRSSYKTIPEDASVGIGAQSAGGDLSPSNPFQLVTLNGLTKIEYPSLADHDAHKADAHLQFYLWKGGKMVAADDVINIPDS